MSKQYLATNLLLESLSLNLDTYDPGAKDIDKFTLSQVEKLIGKMQQFLNDCTLVPFVEDAKGNRDKIMLYFYQQPNVVRCRMCGKCLNEYEAVIEHIKQHERSQGPDVNKPIAKSFIKKNCIPRVNTKAPKDLKKFLKKNYSTLIEGITAESLYVQLDVNNKRVQEELEAFLKPSYPSMKCYPFGSRIVGTGSFSSDLDMFVDLENVYFGRDHVTDTEDAELTETIANVESMLRASKKWTVDVVILNARVPLLRVVCSKYDNLLCDLTFSNGLAHRNSLLLLYMFGLQPTARQLVCYLKIWNNESLLNSYTLSLMVIYMYQCRNLLPSVAKLQESSDNDVIIEGWNAGFATPTLEELKMRLWTSPITGLANMFFEFYNFEGGYCSLETHIVCPYLGNMRVRKSYFEPANYDEIPPQMERLKNYMLQHQMSTDPKRLFAYNKPFVVQDPFEHSHNVAKAISVETASRVMRWMELSIASIENKGEHM